MPKRICPDCGDMHELADWPHNHRRPDEVLCAPRVSTDTMPLTEHIDGKFYDSKSMFRKVTRDSGYIEVGNDPARLRPKQRPAPDHKAIRDSLDKAKARFDRGERTHDKFKFA